MFRSMKFILILICLAAANVAMAQAYDPTVEIILSQATAQQGDMITADIYVRDAVNVGGADIGITVDDQCLRIVSRDEGTFLPMSSEQGGFLPYSELSDHNTRLAAAVTNRAKIGNGDGLFYRVQLQVTCSEGIAPFYVSFAELSAYKDPAAQEIELVSYTMGLGNVVTRNTTLTIGGGGARANNVPANAPEATIVQEPISGVASSSLPIPLIIVLVLAVLGGGSLFIVFRIARRSDEAEQEA